MDMVGDQGPGIAARLCFLKDATETIEEVLMVVTILKDGTSLNPPDNDMMKSAGSIDAGFAGHGKVWHENR